MKSPLANFRPQPQISARQQVTDTLREMVADGTLKPGERLPSTRELGTLWQLPEPTVHRALTPLTKEGLLVRTPRLGTFVRRRRERLEHVAIYVPENWHEGKASAFRYALQKELSSVFEDAEIKGRVWLDLRTRAAHGQPWDELVNAACRQHFQALIVLGAGKQALAWLKKLPVPLVHLGSISSPSRVWFDFRRLADLGMQALAEQGCRRVGVISSLYPWRMERGDGTSESGLFYRQLPHVATRLGLELRPEWIVHPESWPGGTDFAHQHFGYEQMQRLWRQAEQPDGLMVFDDAVAGGVLMAAMQLQIQIPERLRLVLHRNAEIGLFCPLPVAFLDLHVHDIAKALLDQARRLYGGREIAPVAVAHRLVHQSECNISPCQLNNPIHGVKRNELSPAR